MKKRVLAVLCAMTLLAGCGGGGGAATGGSGAKPIDLKMSVTTSESSVWMVAAEEFKKIVEEETEGRYTVSIFPNEQLSSGDMPKGVEMLYTGTTDLDIHSAMIHTGFEPKLTVVSMPWLFENGYESVDEILFNGPGKEAVFDLIRGKGAEPLGLGENGFRQITNNARPITKPEDLKKLKIRTPAIAMILDVFKQMGADPTAMNFGEVFTALQQGTIDGQENPYDTIRSNKINEVQKYMSVWNYSYDPIVLSSSGKLWNSLSDDDKAIFKNAAEKACALQVEKSREMDGDIVQQFKDGGMQITELTPEQVAEFKKVAAPVYDAYRDEIGDDLFAAFGYKFQ